MHLLLADDHLPHLPDDLVASGLEALDALLQFGGVRINLSDRGH